MTKEVRKSLNNFGAMEVGHSITRGGTPEQIHAFRCAAHAFGKRHGRIFRVRKIAYCVVQCERMPDDLEREVPNAKYSFHSLEVGDSVVLPYSKATQSAAWMYAKRKNMTITSKKNPDETMTITRSA